MDITVIICTYNRAESLRRTLETCCDLVIPEGVNWELLVVDNNSTDHTKQVCESFTGKLPLRYIFEPRQGKSCALNHGMAQAGGELFVLTDDDVDITPHWISELWYAASHHPEAMFFGGKILSRWESLPPRWVIENQKWIGINCHIDYGNQVLFSVPSKPVWFVGANWALRKQVFLQGIKYREDIGVIGIERVAAGEENALQRQLLATGLSGLYVPESIVYHRHPAKRQTERYLRRYHKWCGIGDVRLGKITTVHPWFGVSRAYWKDLVFSSVKYALSRWTAPSRIWLRAEIRMAETWGVVCEIRRQHVARQKSHKAQTC
jgi:glycosyltransferase involved in cell wall biosynthesis